MEPIQCRTRQIPEHRRDHRQLEALCTYSFALSGQTMLTETGRQHAFLRYHEHADIRATCTIGITCYSYSLFKL